MPFNLFDFLLWNTNNDILKKVSLFFVHKMKVNEVQCCFGPHWLSLHEQKQFFKISYFVFHWRKLFRFGSTL